MIKGISIYPNKELRKKIDKICGEEQRSFNNLVIIILTKYVEEREKRPWKKHSVGILYSDMELEKKEKSK